MTACPPWAVLAIPAIAFAAYGMMKGMDAVYKSEGEFDDIVNVCKAKGGLLMHNPLRCEPYPEKFDGGCAKAGEVTP